MASKELYEFFKLWHNPCEKIPSNKEFIKNVGKHVTYDKNVRLESKITSGYKNIEILNEYKLKK